MISPGFCALPSGIFSTKPTTPIALTFAFLLASDNIVPTTAAEPPISPIISSILLLGLIEMPPESKHTPFPTKQIGLAFLALFPFQCIITN